MPDVFAPQLLIGADILGGFKRKGSWKDRQAGEQLVFNSFVRDCILAFVKESLLSWGLGRDCAGRRS